MERGFKGLSQEFITGAENEKKSCRVKLQWLQLVIEQF